VKEHALDVSELLPPAPLEHILDALADLPAGDCLRVIHRREPRPLYSMLHRMGYRWSTTCHAVDRYEILVWPEDLPPPTGRAD
jgi:uncharacterized protein (DUF2249 family)